MPQKREQMPVFFHMIRDLIQHKQLYLRHDLKLEEICMMLNTNPRALNAALKAHGFRNFAHFINHYRVEEVKKMMAQETFGRYTLEAIAEMAGFGTRQAFYNTFEKLTGQRPAYYRSLIAKAEPVKEVNLTNSD